MLISLFSTGNKIGISNKFQKPQGKFQNKFQKGAPSKFAKGDSNPKADVAKPAEKVDWNKFKQDKKELRLKRKAARTGFDKIHEAKQIYEKLKWYFH